MIIFNITDAIYEFLTKFTELAIGGPRIYILGDCEFTYLITYIYTSIYWYENKIILGVCKIIYIYMYITYLVRWKSKMPHVKQVFEKYNF